MRDESIGGGDVDVALDLVVVHAVRADALEVELRQVVATVQTDIPTVVVGFVLVVVEVDIALGITKRRTDLARGADLEVDTRDHAVDIAVVTAGEFVAVHSTPAAEAGDPDGVELEALTPLADLRHRLKLLRHDILEQIWTWSSAWTFCPCSTPESCCR